MDGAADGLEVKKVDGAEIGGEAGNESGGWMPVPGEIVQFTFFSSFDSEP